VEIRDYSRLNCLIVPVTSQLLFFVEICADSSEGRRPESESKAQPCGSRLNFSCVHTRQTSFFVEIRVLQNNMQSNQIFYFSRFRLVLANLQGCISLNGVDTLVTPTAFFPDEN